MGYLAGGLGFGCAIGLILSVLSPQVAVIGGLVASVLILGWLLAGTAAVEVDLGDVTLNEGPILVAGRARIEAEHVGAAVPLSSSALRAALGPNADARAYVCHRPWLKQGVRVEITDPHDPTPYWLIASRRPVELARALEQAAQAAHSEHTS